MTFANTISDINAEGLRCNFIGMSNSEENKSIVFYLVYIHMRDSSDRNKSTYSSLRDHKTFYIVEPRLSRF